MQAKGILRNNGLKQSIDRKLFASKKDEIYTHYKKIKEILFSNIAAGKARKLNLYDVYNVAIKKEVFGYSYDELSCLIYSSYGVNITSTSLSERCEKISVNDLIKLNYDLMSYYESYWKEHNAHTTPRILCCDGTECKADISLKEYKYDAVDTDKYCVFFVSTIFDTSLHMPIAYYINKFKDERNDVTVLLEHVRENDIIIFDRGYPAFVLMKELNDRNIKYVMRVSNSWRYVDDIDNVPMSGENDVIDKSYFAGDHLYENTPVRIIKYYIDKQPYYILSNLFDTDKYDFKDLYFKRWSVEVFYDKFKNNVNGKRFYAKTEGNLLISVHLKFTALLITIIMIGYVNNLIGTCSSAKQYNFTCALHLTVNSIIDDMLNSHNNDCDIFFNHLLKIHSYVVTSYPGRSFLRWPKKENIINGDKKRCRLKSKKNVEQITSHSIYHDLDMDDEYKKYKETHYLKNSFPTSVNNNATRISEKSTKQVIRHTKKQETNQSTKQSMRQTAEHTTKPVLKHGQLLMHQSTQKPMAQYQDSMKEIICEAETTPGQESKQMPKQSSKHGLKSQQKSMKQYQDSMKEIKCEPITILQNESNNHTRQKSMQEPMNELRSRKKSDNSTTIINNYGSVSIRLSNSKWFMTP